MSDVRVRYFAAARQAVGLAEQTLDGADGLAGVVAVASGRSPEAAAVLARCTFLVGGARRDVDGQPLPDGATVDVLPPFAGG